MNVRTLSRGLIAGVLALSAGAAAADEGEGGLNVLSLSWQRAEGGVGQVDAYASAALTEVTSLEAGVGESTDSGGDDGDSRFARAALVFEAEGVNVRLGARYFHDRGLLRVRDQEAALRLPWGAWRATAEAVRREAELDVLVVRAGRFLNERRLPLRADGYGLKLAYQGEALSVHLGARRFDYGERLNEVVKLERYYALRLPRLRQDYALYRKSAYGGLDWSLGEHMLYLTLSRDHHAITDGSDDTYSLGWQLPLGEAWMADLWLGETDTPTLGRQGFAGLSLAYGF